MKIRIRPGQMLSDLWRRFAPSALICLLLAAWGVAGEAISLYASDALKAAASSPIDYTGAALAMGLLFATAASCLCERYRWPGILAWAAAALGAGTGALFVWMEKPGMIPVGVILCGFALCLHAVSRKDAPAVRLGLIGGRFLTASFVSGLLFGALALSISAVFALFLPDAPWELNEMFMISGACISFMLVAPVLFLSGLPEEKAPSSPGGFQKFAAFLLFPFYYLPAAILIFYVAKIIITWSMPVGVMNGYSIYALTAFVFFHLILTGEENGLSRFFKRWGGWLLIPIAAVQAIAVHMRVSAYGLTESRVLGMVWTALCLAAVAVSLFRRRAGWFFLTAAAVSFITLCTPLSAGNLAVMNQESRLLASLTESNMLDEEGRIISNPEASLKNREIIYSAADYLYDVSARKGSFTEQLQQQIDAIRNDDGVPEDGLSMISPSAAKIRLFGFGKPEQTDDDWSSRTYVFEGTAVSSRVETSGYVLAEWISAHLYSDSNVAAWSYDKDESSGLICLGTTDLSALIACLEKSLESGDPLDLTVPVTLVIDGEEADIAPLLNGISLTGDEAASLPADTLILPSGRKLHISSLRVRNYSNTDTDDYITFSAWLLTPAEE